MSLTRHSLAVAKEMKRVLEAGPRNVEIPLASMVQESIEKWINKVSGNRMNMKKMKCGILDFDADTILTLLQCNLDVVHCIGAKHELKQWCCSDDANEITIQNVPEILMPYYPSARMSPLERKLILEGNKDLLLGNPIFHLSSYRSSDLLVGIGSIIFAFVYCACDVFIGKMATIMPHVSIASDVVVGDYCHIEANVTIGNSVRIGESVKIGAGAIICPGVTIAAFSVIMPGQLVKFNIGK